MTTYNISQGDRLHATVNTLVFLKCDCGKRATVDLDGPPVQECEHCLRKILKVPADA